MKIKIYNLLIFNKLYIYTKKNTNELTAENAFYF